MTRLMAAALCLSLPCAAAAQPRRVYTDTDPATGAHLARPAVVLRQAVSQPPNELLAALKAREFVYVPDWPGAQAYAVADPGPDWPFLPGTQARAREAARFHNGMPPGVSVVTYGWRPRPIYGPLVSGSNVSTGRGQHGR